MIGRKQTSRLFFVLAFLFSRLHAASAQSGLLGVLEDVPPVYAGDSDKPAVRVVFQFDGSKWKAFPSDCPNQECLQKVAAEYPAAVRWSIGFNGREIARISSRTPAQFDFYAHVGLQILDQPSQAPKIGQKSEEFSGFTGDAVYRPQVANSQPFFSDPDQWRELPVPGGVARALHRAFRRENPKLCKRDQTDETRSTSFAYSDAQVRISKAFKSKAGTWVAELQLDNASSCDDVVEFDDPWFSVKSDGSTNYVGEGLRLVAVGDFNHDGRSEMLFSIDRYNRGGYELFYDQFAKHVSFEFSFH